MTVEVEYGSIPALHFDLSLPFCILFSEIITDGRVSGYPGNTAASRVLYTINNSLQSQAQYSVLYFLALLLNITSTYLRS
jgi:hypothetical protein